LDDPVQSNGRKDDELMMRLGRDFNEDFGRLNREFDEDLTGHHHNHLGMCLEFARDIWEEEERSTNLREFETGIGWKQVHWIKRGYM
jgi:hypothetical protein